MGNRVELYQYRQYEVPLAQAVETATAYSKFYFSQGTRNWFGVEVLHAWQLAPGVVVIVEDCTKSPTPALRYKTTAGQPVAQDQYNPVESCMGTYMQALATAKELLAAYTENGTFERGQNK